MSQQAATCPYRELVFDTHTLASCSRCSNLPDLDQDSKLLASHMSGLMNGVFHSKDVQLCHERHVLVHFLAEITQIITTT